MALKKEARSPTVGAHRQGGVSIEDGTHRTVIDKLVAAGLVTCDAKELDVPCRRKVPRFELTVRVTPAGRELYTA